MTETNQDVIELFHDALIQHGPYNDRVYAMKIPPEGPEALAEQLKGFAGERRYGKIFAKVPQSRAEAFVQAGFEQEAAIPGFYQGRDDAVFLAFYLDPARRVLENAERLDEILQLALERRDQPCPESMPQREGREVSASSDADGQRDPGAEDDTEADSGEAGWDEPSVWAEQYQDDSAFRFRVCSPEDVDTMAQLYGCVFPSYPFPIHDPAYLAQIMASHVRFVTAESDGRMVALASTEMDAENKAVEMTDFATLHEWRGQRLARRLLIYMEQLMRAEEMITAFTIARAVSPGMNITFARLGYEYGGRLVNNTNIGGAIESMNVWHKRL